MFDKGQSAGDIGTALTQMIQTMGTVVVPLGYMIGLMLGISAIIGIKQYVEDPECVSVSSAITKLIMSGMFASLGSVFSATVENLNVDQAHVSSIGTSNQSVSGSNNQAVQEGAPAGASRGVFQSATDF